MKKSFLAFVLASFLSFNSASAVLNLFPNVQEPRFEVGYAIGDFISVHRNYAEVGLFLPVSFNTWQPFIDVTGYRFDNGKWASSAGLGIRKICNECSAIGVNAYYDYRRSDHRRDFHQLGVGFEWLNKCWDIRVNTYFPVGDKNQTARFCKFDIGDNFHATRRLNDYAYSGFDAEIGAPFLRYCGFDLYGAIGPYYYRNHHKHVKHRDFTGGFIRLELDWMTVFSIQLLASHDRVYRTNVQGIFAVAIPFDFFCFNSCNENCGCECGITQAVQRNGIIQLDHCCNWTWNW